MGKTTVMIDMLYPLINGFSMYRRFHAVSTMGFEGIEQSRLAVFLTALITLVITGCASVPFDYPKTTSYTQAPDPNTLIGNAAMEWQQEHEGESGFISLPDGIDALGARLRMMASAQNSIDAQYFILKADRAGALFVGKMLLAADRGVQVRLLIDDIFSPGIDRQLTLLDSHPNIEVRMFNPVSRNSLRYWAYLLDFGRTNRRMHNKSFTVDSSMSIVGGRNIGEEYFELTQDVLFDDFELFVMGPVVQEIGAGFDEFWNSQLAVPIAAFGARVDPEDLDSWRTMMYRESDEDATGIYAQAVNSTMLRDIREQRITPVPARAELITDSPDKLLHEVGDKEMAVLAQEKGRRLAAAQREIVLITPYFIPQQGGLDLVRELVARGVRVVIVTNSLASTNHVAVHGHYARYRRPLLQAGAELYEIRAEFEGQATTWGHSPDQVTLHSKASIIDRKTIFVGSLNLDPRSIQLNTEMGLFIDSATMGADFAEAVLQELPRVTYRVELDSKDKLSWTYLGGATPVVSKKEPQASWGRRFMAGFYRVLPIENQL